MQNLDIFYPNRYSGEMLIQRELLPLLINDRLENVTRLIRVMSREANVSKTD